MISKHKIVKRKASRGNVCIRNLIYSLLVIIPSILVYCGYSLYSDAKTKLSLHKQNIMKMMNDKLANNSPILNNNMNNIKSNSDLSNIKMTTPPVPVTNAKSNVNSIDEESVIEVGNSPQSSKYAYVTLISGIDKRFKYRGFLYNALIMRRALKQLGSTADFIAMLGFSDTSDISLFMSDIDLLKSHGIIVHHLPRLLDDQHKLNFAEMALLKITPYSFTNYNKIQFFDGDVMPTKNMDCFFELNYNAFTLGAVSPLNSGWYLAIPDQKAFEYMKEKAIWRLGRDWDKKNGWNEAMPAGMTVRGGKAIKVWQFNGADMDQGLFCHYFAINHGNVILIDTVLKKVKYYAKGILHEQPTSLSMREAVSCCHGASPMIFYAHFTGRSKPWMSDLSGNIRGSKKLWVKHLDALNLPINSKNISTLSLGSPLGYWNAGFPKGGYKKKDTDKR